ncbi:unnamed protein product, partial [Prorocentrum cordatum]
ARSRSPLAPAGAQSPTIGALLARCGPGTLCATMEALGAAARTEDRDAWEPCFGRVLVLVLDSLTDPELQDWTTPGVPRCCACRSCWCIRPASSPTSWTSSPTASCGRSGAPAWRVRRARWACCWAAPPRRRPRRSCCWRLSAGGAEARRAASRLLPAALQRMTTEDLAARPPGRAPAGGRRRARQRPHRGAQGRPPSGTTRNGMPSCSKAAGTSPASSAATLGSQDDPRAPQRGQPPGEAPTGRIRRPPGLCRPEPPASLTFSRFPETEYGANKFMPPDLLPSMELAGSLAMSDRTRDSELTSDLYQDSPKASSGHGAPLDQRDRRR